MKNAGNKLVVVDFYRVGNHYRNQIASYLESPKRPFAGKFVLLRMHLGDHEDFARKRYGIDGSPAYVFLKNGKVIETQKLYNDSPAPVDIAIYRLTMS